jgi:RNA polymerase sigma-70 factor (ECF subfamily)
MSADSRSTGMMSTSVVGTLSRRYEEDASGLNNQVRTEMELVAALHAGDRDAFAYLYETHVERVYRYLLGIVRNTQDAEDLAADVFVRAVERIGKYRYQGVPIISWLLCIAHNLAMNSIKRRAKHPEQEIQEYDSISEDPSDEALQNIRYAEVVKAMAGLTELQRQVLSLRFGASLNVEETSAVMDKKPQAVRVLQHSALRALRRQMDVEKGSDDE